MKTIKNWCKIDLPDVGSTKYLVMLKLLQEAAEANDEEDDQPIKPAISHKEATQSLTTAVKW